MNRSLTLGDGGPDDVAGAVLAFYDPRYIKMNFKARTLS
jgi:hypothetical protein